jgi:hypothetical protein
MQRRPHEPPLLELFSCLRLPVALRAAEPGGHPHQDPNTALVASRFRPLVAAQNMCGCCRGRTGAGAVAGEGAGGRAGLQHELQPAGTKRAGGKRLLTGMWLHVSEPTIELAHACRAAHCQEKHRHTHPLKIACLEISWHLIASHTIVCFIAHTCPWMCHICLQLQAAPKQHTHAVRRQQGCRFYSRVPSSSSPPPPPSQPSSLQPTQPLARLWSSQIGPFPPRPVCRRQFHCISQIFE